MNEFEKHKGRFAQAGIYIGKLFRMFIYQSEWKVMPMAAVMTVLVALVVKKEMCATMEGTVQGSFALACISIWNGMFNSIQTVCRERPIIKREHRSGLHISAYVMAQMIYQAFLCLCQSCVMIAVLKAIGVKLPASAYITSVPLVDTLITLFLIGYAADMMALFISSLVRNPMTAMTIMPFLLMFQLVFAGLFFELRGVAAKASDFTLTKSGVTALCAQSDYNKLPMATVWKTLSKMQNVEFEQEKPVKLIVDTIEEEGRKEEFMLKCGSEAQNENYKSDSKTISNCWFDLFFYALVFALLSMISLEFIDKDKR